MKMEKAKRMRAVVGRAGRSATAESGTELDPGRRKSVTGNRLMGMILGPNNRMAHEWLGGRGATRPTTCGNAVFH